ncbi:hypothetical protein ONZ45_g736 [Pleurotus djamor]|nr:hypothetical protein ONZ45_g736 [Pleurotus djamor]
MDRRSNAFEASLNEDVGRPQPASDTDLPLCQSTPAAHNVPSQGTPKTSKLKILQKVFKWKSSKNRTRVEEQSQASPVISQISTPSNNLAPTTLVDNDDNCSFYSTMTTLRHPSSISLHADDGSDASSYHSLCATGPVDDWEPTILPIMAIPHESLQKLPRDLPGLIPSSTKDTPSTVTSSLPPTPTDPIDESQLVPKVAEVGTPGFNAPILPLDEGSPLPFKASPTIKLAAPGALTLSEVVHEASGYLDTSGDEYSNAIGPRALPERVPSPDSAPSTTALTINHDDGLIKFPESQCLEDAPVNGPHEIPYQDGLAKEAQPPSPLPTSFTDRGPVISPELRWLQEWKWLPRSIYNPSRVEKNAGQASEQLISTSEEGLPPESLLPNPALQDVKQPNHTLEFPSYPPKPYPSIADETLRADGACSIPKREAAHSSATTAEAQTPPASENSGDDNHSDQPGYSDLDPKSQACPTAQEDIVKNIQAAEAIPPEKRARLDFADRLAHDVAIPGSVGGPGLRPLPSYGLSELFYPSASTPIVVVRTLNVTNGGDFFNGPINNGNAGGRSNNNGVTNT